jgi:hypothetical protein
MLALPDGLHGAVVMGQRRGYDIHRVAFIQQVFHGIEIPETELLESFVGSSPVGIVKSNYGILRNLFEQPDVNPAQVSRA